MTRHTIIAMMLFGFVSAGSSCDEGPDVQGSDGFSTSAPDEADENNGEDSPTNYPLSGTATNTQTTTTAEYGTRGVLMAGDACQSTRQCTGGMACEAGLCVESGELRISMSWEQNTDVDLHVRNPDGEEIWYRNREAQDGGQFQKDGCIASRCDETTGPRIEAVIWRDEPKEGTYEFWGINYDAVTSANVRFEVHYRGRVERFSASLPQTAGAQSPIFAYTVGNSGGPGQLEFVRPTEEEWVRGPSVNFSVRTGDNTIKRVGYFAERVDLGSSTSGPNFNHTYNFTNLGEHDITARGYDNSGMELDNDKVKIVVMDQNNGLPNPGRGAVVSDWLLAKRILFHSGAINLYNRQVSGRNDGADASSNMRAVSQKQTARNSCYGNAPCGRVQLDARMLQAMVILRQVYGYSFRVTSIAGGSHSARSRHYRGVAFDVDIINGSSVASNRTMARRFMQSCRELGATEVLGPGNRGHSGHVHCAW